MKNQADYSLYECPFSHIEKEFGHKLVGPEGYEKTYGIWCACGFRGPVFCLEPDVLRLKKLPVSAKALSEKRLDNRILCRRLQSRGAQK